MFKALVRRVVYRVVPSRFIDWHAYDHPQEVWFHGYYSFCGQLIA
jgi:hypothetical protein